MNHNLVITVARKPLSEGTLAKNALKHGTGGLNIDGSRVGQREKERFVDAKKKSSFGGNAQDYKNPKGYERSTTPLPDGRWPANLILASPEAIEVLDVQSGLRVSRFFKMVTAGELVEADNEPNYHRSSEAS